VVLWNVLDTLAFDAVVVQTPVNTGAKDSDASRAGRVCAAAVVVVTAPIESTATAKAAIANLSEETAAVFMLDPPLLRRSHSRGQPARADALLHSPANLKRSAKLGEKQ